VGQSPYPDIETTVSLRSWEFSITKSSFLNPFSCQLADTLFHTG
jgi:hypothetical protein